MTYLYQNKDWPSFLWDTERLVSQSPAARYKQGLLLGKIRTGIPAQSGATLAALTEETVKSLAIEGEGSIRRASGLPLARRMGLKEAGTRPWIEMSKASSR